VYYSCIRTDNDDSQYTFLSNPFETTYKNSQVLVCEIISVSPSAGNREVYCTSSTSLTRILLVMGDDTAVRNNSSSMTHVYCLLNRNKTVNQPSINYNYSCAGRARCTARGGSRTFALLACRTRTARRIIAVVRRVRENVPRVPRYGCRHKRAHGVVRVGTP
jgi:hypothetical protein